MPDGVNATAPIERFFARLGQGAATVADCHRLIDGVRKDGVTASERRRLIAGLYSRADRIDRDGRKAIESFVQKDFRDEYVGTPYTRGEAGVEMAVPRVMWVDRKRATYEWVEGTVWGVDGPKPDDPVQSVLGDCYWIAACVAVAAVRPDMLKKTLSVGDDGAITAHLYDRVGRSKSVRDIPVDTRLPTVAGGLLYSHCRDPGKLWVSLLEKAYAEYRGKSYNAIGKGGMASQALEAITGRVSKEWVILDSDPEWVYQKIEKSLAAGRCGVADSCSDYPEDRFVDSGVIPFHGYAILGAREHDGEKLIRLRNPWGEVEPGGHGPDDGIFELEVGDFLKYFGRLSFA